MKMKAEKHNKSREGAALVMVMLVLLIFSSLQIGLYKLREIDGVESVYVEQHKQAFWLAEDGLNDGSFLINYSLAFRDNLTTITNTKANGTCAISVVKNTIIGSPGTYEYEITSVGTVNGFNRRLRKVIQTFDAGKYAIIGISGTTSLSANVDVYGPIAQIDGDVIIKDSRNLYDGYVVVGNGALTDPKGQALVVNYPPPPVPSINNSYYMTELNYVSTLPNTPTETRTAPIAAGDTVYFNTDKLFLGKPGSPITIGNGAKIVASGDIRFGGAGSQIGDNVTIISGNDLSFKVQVSVGAGSDFYAWSDITLESGSQLQTNGDPIILLAQNDNIEMRSNFDFTGIMIAANGILDISANGTITGTVIAGLGVDAAANITIRYDETVFAALRAIVPNLTSDVILTAISWQELRPL